MTFSRNSRRVWLVGALLVAAILCQGQSCVPASPAFEIVGSPDDEMDGTYALVFTASGSTATTQIQLQNGLPTTKGTGAAMMVIDGQSHARTTTDSNGQPVSYTYVATGQAGRSGSSFTMEIVTTITMANSVPSVVTQTMTFSGTIGANGVISGNGSETASASGYQDQDTDYTFTMTKQ